MKHISRLSILAMLGIILLSSCHSVPQHARYIPKDAALVIGVNIKEIGKSVAWSTITGSKLLDEMKERSKNEKGKTLVNDIEKSGIDWMNTIYFYGKPDKRYANTAKMSVVAPLSSAAEWETFVKKLYPGIVIKKVKDRSEALLGDKAYAGWTSSVLIINNLAVAEVTHTGTAKSPAGEPVVADAAAVDVAAADAAAIEFTDTAIVATTEEPVVSDSYTWTEKAPDSAATYAEMEASFNLPKDAAITDNDRFTKLDKENHDISVYVAYDALMDNYALKQNLGMMSMMMGASLWKNAAMSTGIDFNKGQIAADVLYYPSDSMKSVAKAAGKDNMDKSLLSRIPGQNLNFVMGYHLAPESLKLLLDKLNMSGMANLFLMQKNTSIDDILSIFTGDMVVSMNDFSMNKVTITPDSTYAAMYGSENTPAYDDYKPQMNVIYSIKIKDKAKLDKLLSMVNEEANIQPVAHDKYQFPIGRDTITVLIDEKLLVVSNKLAAATAFLQNKSGSVPEVINKEIAGHPLGIFVDIKSLLATVGSNMSHSKSDSAMFHEVSNLFDNAKMTGGEFKDQGNEYHLELNFMNKTENSLIQLMNLAQRMSAADKNQQPAVVRN